MRGPTLPLAALTVAAASGTASAMPLPPKQVYDSSAGGATNVKVRRIGELKIDSTTAPPPAIALTGQHKMLVLLVETKDSPWPKGYEPSRFQEMLFSKETSSLREYYRENSYGAYDVVGQVLGPVRVAGSMKDYAFEMGGNNDKVKKLIEESVRELGKKTRLNDFDTHDGRGRPGSDGVLDHLMVIYAEKTGEPQGFSPIWPHRGSMDFDAGDVRVNSYVVINHGAPLGVYVHEFGHDIGLPDLYDRGYTSYGAGRWCVMAEGGWGEGGAKPSHISAWGKARLGWIVPTIVSKSASGIAVASSSEKPFALKLPFGAVDSREYFLVENRRKVGFDESLPTEGLVIWHIDETRSDNDDPKRKMVDVVEAAPVQDLDYIEQGRPPDYLPDVFYKGGRDAIDDSTTPSTRANDGEPTKIKLKVTTAADRVMNVDIERPEIWNPGGVPFTLDKDGYRFGRFGYVPTGKGSEALVRFETTPGGYIVFAVEAFFTGAPTTRATAWLRMYEDRGNGPGKLLREKDVTVITSPDGYAWARAALAPDTHGMKLEAKKRFWIGVAVDHDKIVAAFNPFSASKEARYRRGPGKELIDHFNFKEGAEPIADYIVRVEGFGYLDGFERPEPLAAEDDAQVKRIKAANALADNGEFEEAIAEYTLAEKEMSKSPRRYESWLPVVVNAIGVASYELKHYDEAMDRFQTSLRRAQAAHDQLAEGDILQNLCETAFHKGDFEESKKNCDRSRRINLTLARHDRLVENYYWLARAQQQGAKGKDEHVAENLKLAKSEVEQAFPKVPSELEAWRKRIQRALDGDPEDADKVVQRVEKVDKGGPKQKAQYTDLLQFLGEDTRAK
jgi:M6 family metalloprotease-like protein